MSALILTKKKRSELSKQIHYFSLCLIVIGIVCSKAMMSIGMIIGGFSILIDPLLLNHIKSWFSNKLIVILMAFILLHLISFLWSSNISYAFGDLKTKISLLIIPLIIVSKPINDLKKKKFIFSLFIMAMLVTSIINMACYFHLIGDVKYDDIRGLSLFGSHIRYTVLIAFACILCFHRIINKEPYSFFYLFSLFVFLFYLFYAQVLSAYISFFVAFLVYFSYLLYLKKYYSRLILLNTFFLCFSFLVIGFLSYSDKKDDTIVNESELKESWNIRSKISYDKKDAKNQEIKYTLIRYLQSKSLPLNKSGLDQLDGKDVKNIEKGVADYREENSGLISRLYSLRFEIHNSGDPNGHSLLQRLEYWKAGLSIFKKNWWFGVGSGDVQDAFDREYVLNNSKLKKQNRKRAHNMFLTMAITFGFPGLAFFIYKLIFFVKKQIQNKQLIGLVFSAIVISTFFMEDTLETQTGITFYAFFYGYFSMEIKQKE